MVVSRLTLRFAAPLPRGPLPNTGSLMHKGKRLTGKQCPECGASMKPGRTTLHFERGGFYADVENVKALLCSRCGTRSIPGQTALKVSKRWKGCSRLGKNLIQPEFPSI